MRFLSARPIFPNRWHGLPIPECRFQTRRMIEVPEEMGTGPMNAVGWYTCRILYGKSSVHDPCMSICRHSLLKMSSRQLCSSEKSTNEQWFMFTDVSTWFGLEITITLNKQSQWSKKLHIVNKSLDIESYIWVNEPELRLGVAWQSSVLVCHFDEAVWVRSFW